MLHGIPFSFLGVESDFKKARAAVLPVPYDSTVSYGTGARNGPHAIIAASRQVELYDVELGSEPAKAGVFTLDELEPARGSAEITMERVKGAVKDIFEAGKFPLVLGGEHSISFAAVDALAACCGGKEEFSVLVLDAHADLREEYEGSKFSHACVSRRIHEVVPSVFEVGVRSMSKEEADFAKGKGSVEIISADEVLEKGVEKVAKAILPKLKKKVYVSVDLDVLDPSEMPSVGTPEPGGLRWREATRLLRVVGSGKQVIGADLVELAPVPGLNAPDFLAAKLAYKMLAYFLR